MEIAEDSKYENAVIYKLVCSDGHYYYGSTTNYMNRLNIHKAHSILYPHTPLYKHIADIGWNNVKLEIIEHYPCDNNKELTTQEDTYIKKAFDMNDTLCLNTNRAHTTGEEKKESVKTYYENNKEAIIEQHKKYREDNAEKLKEYHTVYNVLNAEKKIAYSKKYSEENKEKVLEGNRKYYEKNKEAILKKTNEYKEAHKEEYQLYKKAYYEENKEKYAEMARVRREENKEAIAEKSKEYYEENREKILEKFKVYREREENKDKNKEYQKEYRGANKAKQSEKHECSCGGVYTLNHKTIHENSKKHLLHMAQRSV